MDRHPHEIRKAMDDFIDTVPYKQEYLDCMIAAVKKMEEGPAQPITNDERAQICERAAQLIAHRECIAHEHDPLNGKIHWNCMVCGVPWPCDIATTNIAGVRRA